MPRIPVRTTPYHTLPRCTRHYKSKRDLILRALGKASFINGSQFVIAWISPKGEVDVYASELLQGVMKDGTFKKEMEREAVRVKGEMGKRWEEVRRLEEKGEALVMEDGDEEDPEAEQEDPDTTLVEMETPVKQFDAPPKKPSPSGMMSTFTARSSTPAPPMHTLTLAQDAIDGYYTSRFAALQQATCKLVVKAWIKVIEPKKQMKFPYNKGEELKPAWWPEGVRHREPDHLSKTERLTLLASIIRSPLVTVSRLELSTAEAAAFISQQRLAILREVYLVAKEEEKHRGEKGDLIVHLPHVPVSPSAISPEGGEKRPIEEKENLYQAKRPKTRLPALAVSTQANYNYAHPFTFAPQSHLSWRESGLGTAPPPHHLSPYDAWSGGSDYHRSPNPGAHANPSADERLHPNHLAPILNTTPTDSPSFAQSSSLPTGYFPRSHAGQSYMQQQQMEYLQQHQHSTAQYDYGSPYIADNSWEGGFSQPS